jgi:hypothetical protein
MLFETQKHAGMCSPGCTTSTTSMGFRLQAGCIVAFINLDPAAALEPAALVLCSLRFLQGIVGYSRV